jgi:hypothetical protein
MAIQNYKVAIGPDRYTVNYLTDVQNITVNIGRQAQLDQYNSSTATVTLRYPTGYASPNAFLKTGNFAQIYNFTSGRVISEGVISNVTVRYGIPYGGGVGNADFVDFTIEGTLARLGRMQGNNYAMSAGKLSAQASSCQAQTIVPIVASVTNDPSMAGTTVSTTWADWLNRAALTTNSRLIDSYSDQITIRSPFNLDVSEYNFSDTTNNFTNQVYDQINFGSLADNYYTQVSVAPEGFSVQTVTKSGASAPYRTLLTNTFNASNAQALDFANYLLANYGTQRFALVSVSAVAEAQNSFHLDGAGYFLGDAIGRGISVTFRGTTYNSVIEGVTMSATPEGSRYTFYLSGADLNAFLLLDNSIYGRLDYNKLGY